jgi:signal transduction histidine kinase
LIVSQEEERRGIARELHDDIGQRLSMITSEMHLLKTDCDFESSEKKTALERLSEELDTLVTDLHNVSYRLHSSKLQHLGIRSSLHRLCQRLAHSGLCVDLTVGEEIESVPDDIAICLFRVAQEALSNVLKYSGATCAILTLTRKRGRYFMAIKDSGKGFDMDACPRGLGLISITERVRLLHGEVAISSCHEHGTEIALWIPSTAANLRVGKKLGPVAESARGKAALNY